MNDAAAEYQMAYDQAVHEHGADSEQAKNAEREAHQFFKGKRAPVTPAVQPTKEESWVS